MNTSWFNLVFLFCLTIPGQVIAAQDENPRDGEPALTNTTDTPEVAGSIQQYRDQITRQESEHGPYDPQLSEQLLGLGLLYKNQEQYDEASEALEQALHVKRVNEGVDNLTQVPVLEALIDVNAAAGNWDKLDRNYELLLQVSQRNLASGDPKILANIERAGQWKLLAYDKNLLKKKPTAILHDLIDMNESTVNIIKELYGENDPRMIEPLNGLSMAHYLLTDEINKSPVGEFAGTGEKVQYQRVCRPIRTRQGWIQVCSMEAVSNPNYYISRQHSKNVILNGEEGSVRKYLNRIIKIVQTNPPPEPYELAAALVNLGDWYLLYNMQDAAVNSYQRAYKLFKEDGAESDGIGEIFGRPARIPSMTTSSDIDNDVVRESSEPYVRLSLDVGTNGKPKNIKVIEEGNTKNFMARKTAKAQVASWLFRPRLQDGEAVATKGMEIQLSGAFLRKKPVRKSGPANVTGSRIRR